VLYIDETVEMKDVGETSIVLGIEIHHDRARDIRHFLDNYQL
jgi:hypothetical protein